MLDIDHFKNVNDQYGHKAGDEVLSAVAASIKKSLRGGDVAGRYGGEEFVVLVSGASSEQCFKIAERIRRAVAQQTIRLGQVVVRVTLSLGLAWADPDQVFPVDVLINCADQALYIAKHQGQKSCGGLDAKSTAYGWGLNRSHLCRAEGFWGYVNSHEQRRAL